MNKNLKQILINNGIFIITQALFIAIWILLARNVKSGSGDIYGGIGEFFLFEFAFLGLFCYFVLNNLLKLEKSTNRVVYFIGSYSGFLILAIPLLIIEEVFAGFFLYGLMVFLSHVSFPFFEKFKKKNQG